MSPFLTAVVSLVFIQIAYGSNTTLVHLVTDQKITANKAARLLFDSQVYDNGHHYDINERVISVIKTAKYQLEGHASLTGAGAHSATIKIAKLSNGQETSLAECKTSDPKVTGNRCRIEVEDDLKDGDKVFMEAKATKDATLTNVDTYLFLSEKH
ncbi:hypothetical protein LOTGIDRAFT_157366 [Lottia gigantea]|uniref:Cystatin domain-containing protein n=1 Tax=Lottia gigantea TaxID=225164 RepID=V4AXA5_LOTGI|nr:hypothetical protein LOTGIDRAFT_157366 [Lottia gigantea]ESP02208.1 hypothetical protein LOTGIDRAFT_157366 [Lottia gigantea]